MIEVTVIGSCLLVVGGLAIAHAIYTLRNRPKRGAGWWRGRHPLLTGLVAGWPLGYTGRWRARMLIVVGLALVVAGGRFLALVAS